MERLKAPGVGYSESPVFEPHPLDPDFENFLVNAWENFRRIAETHGVCDDTLENEHLAPDPSTAIAVRPQMYAIRAFFFREIAIHNIQAIFFTTKPKKLAPNVTTKRKSLFFKYSEWANVNT